MKMETRVQPTSNAKRQRKQIRQKPTQLEIVQITHRDVSRVAFEHARGSVPLDFVAEIRVERVEVRS